MSTAAPRKPGRVRADAADVVIRRASDGREFSLPRARYIDEGRPVPWSLSSTRGFNALADSHTKQQGKIAGDGKAMVAPTTGLRREAATLRPDDESGHVCLITGYDRATGERAFSDSWGPGEFWVLNF